MSTYLTPKAPTAYIKPSIYGSALISYSSSIVVSVDVSGWILYSRYQT